MAKKITKKAGRRQDNLLRPKLTKEQAAVAEVASLRKKAIELLTEASNLSKEFNLPFVFQFVDPNSAEAKKEEPSSYYESSTFETSDC